MNCFGLGPKGQAFSILEEPPPNQPQFRESFISLWAVPAGVSSILLATGGISYRCDGEVLETVCKKKNILASEQLGQYFECTDLLHGGRKQAGSLKRHMFMTK